MLCMQCGAEAKKGFTTDVTDLGSGLVTIRNVPCYKCTECNEIIYTANTVRHLENIVEQTKILTQEISTVDYSKTILTAEEAALAAMQEARDIAAGKIPAKSFHSVEALMEDLLSDDEEIFV